MGTELKDRAKEARQTAGYAKVRPWAIALDVSSTAIYLIEDGSTRDLKASTAEAMARLSGLSAEWIRTGKGVKRVSDPPQREPDISPEFHAAQTHNSFYAVRVALGALFAEMAATRPDEAARVAAAIRQTAEPEFVGQGLLGGLLSVLDKAVPAAKAPPARKRVRKP